jgi:hypothetical protein
MTRSEWIDAFGAFATFAGVVAVFLLAMWQSRHDRKLRERDLWQRDLRELREAFDEYSSEVYLRVTAKEYRKEGGYEDPEAHMDLLVWYHGMTRLARLANRIGGIELVDEIREMHRAWEEIDVCVEKPLDHVTAFRKSVNTHIDQIEAARKK